ncbi:MAG TPA: DUF1850 domain-containing protein [Spirochaetales bacterium]|nr:DUF1850 domain-containing protein [Spirochaetales bacterium]HOV37444.1 DUF1850 domain-containing protein [Spirochaetales bacterium]
MHQKKILGSYGLPGISLVVLLGVLYIPVTNCLVVESKEGNTLYCKPWDKADRLEISYLHSVNKSLITDLFTADGKRNLLLISSQFHSFGAGVTTAPETQEGRIVLGKDYLEYTGIQRALPKLGIFVPWQANTTLHFHEEAIPLASLSPPGTLLQIRIIRKPLGELISSSLKSRILQEKL